MAVLTDLIDAKIGRHKKVLEGKILSRPVLIVSDGEQLTYAADVDLGQKALQPGTQGEVVAPLRNVPIAAGNRELLYADVGAAVTLTRHWTGRLEITGFAKSLPGSYTRYPVTLERPGVGLPRYFVGPPEPIGLSARALTYQELATLGGGYGVAPYGAYAVFRGESVLEIRV